MRRTREGVRRDLASSCLGGHDREVDLGLCDLVDIVGQRIEGDVQHDLDHLRVVVACLLDCLNVDIRDVPTRLHQLDGEANRNVRLRIGRDAVAIGGDFGFRELCQVFAKIRCARRGNSRKR